MVKVEYIGKTLLVDGKVLVIGDLHLGYGESLRESGVMVPVDLFKEVVRDLDGIFGELKKRKIVVEKVVLLGDVKHEFGKNRLGDFGEIGELMNYLRRGVREVIIVKGNHDAVIGGVVRKLERVSLVDYLIEGGVAYIHGDRDFPEIHGKDVKVWIVGHGHPAVTLTDKTKQEKYKCFLEGKYKSKEIVIVPSFFDVNSGSDPRDFDLGLAWDFKLEKFKVKVVNEEEGNLEALDFGRLGELT